MSDKKKITIVDNISGELDRLGMTKEELSNIIGIDRKTFSAWKKKGELPGTMLLKCAKALNCSVDYLVRDVDVDM